MHISKVKENGRHKKMHIFKNIKGRLHQGRLQVKIKDNIFLRCFPGAPAPPQARNQDFPKGGAKRGVVAWVQEHRMKRSERGQGLQGGQSSLHRKSS